MVTQSILSMIASRAAKTLFPSLPVQLPFEKMLRVAVICLLFQASVVLSAPLQWPKTYQTSGLIILPYGDISEPFTAIVDMNRGLSYLNTYAGQLMEVYCMLTTAVL